MKKTIKISIIMLVLVSILIPQWAFADDHFIDDPGDGSGGGGSSSQNAMVEFYEHSRFRGLCSKFDGDADISNFNQEIVGDNTISSVKINAPCEVTVYEHINFKGRSYTFRFDVLSFSHEYIRDIVDNDTISSAKIRVLSQSDYDGIYVFEHADYMGRWDRFTSSRAHLAGTDVGDNNMSSIKFIGSFKNNTTVYIHQNADFTGWRYKIEEDVRDFTPAFGSFINDNISSVTILKH